MGYSETQQATGEDTTGEGAFKADGRGKLRTELTAAGAGRAEPVKPLGRRDRARQAPKNPEYPEYPTESCVATDMLTPRGLAGVLPRRCKETRTPMAKRRPQIIETPTEARQAEPGPSVLALLAVSTGLAMLVLGVVWFVFFRT
jgi:hypothetical protein